MSELGRLVAEHAKTVMTTDHGDAPPDGDTVTAPVRSTAAPPVSRTAGVVPARVVTRSPAFETVRGLQQHAIAIGKILAATMATRSPVMELARSFNQQHTILMGKAMAASMVTRSPVMDAVRGLQQHAVMGKAMAATMGTRSPVFEAVRGLQQQHAVMGKAMAATMVTRSPVMELARSFNKQHAALMGKAMAAMMVGRPAVMELARSFNQQDAALMGKAMAATMGTRSPVFEAARSFNQQHAAIGKAMSAMMVTRSPVFEAVRGLQQQHVLAIGEQWANVMNLSLQAGSASAAPLLAAHPSTAIPWSPVLPPADPSVPGWADQWHRMSLFERALFIIAVVTALLTAAQLAVDVAQLLQQQPASVTTEQVRPTNQRSVEVPTTTTCSPWTTTSRPSIIGTPSTTSATSTTRTDH
jgi:hypothetical protein